MEEARANAEGVLAAAARELFEEGVISDSSLARHTLRCLSYLLVIARLELRFVLRRVDNN